MKILLIDHARKHFSNQDRGRWHYLPTLFVKAGHKVKHITRYNWSSFLFVYSSFKPDVVIFTGFAGVFPIAFKKLGFVKCPVVHDWNDCYAEIQGPLIGIAKANFLEGLVVHYSDFITTPTKYLAEKSIGYRKPTTFIPHGTDLNLNVKPEKLSGKLTLLYIGDQTWYKRVDRIIDAVKGLPCDLYLLGTINKKLEEKSPKNTHFLGKVSHEKVGAYIKAADICVSTADQENLKLHEYAKAGKTVLAYRGRIGYALTHMVNAYICEDMRDGLLFLMKNKALMKKLGKNIKELPTLSWKGVSKKYLAFLKNILQSAK